MDLAALGSSWKTFTQGYIKPGEDTDSSGSCLVITSVSPSMSKEAGVVVSNPLLCTETSKSIQEKMEGRKPTESASFLPVSELTGEEKAFHAPQESPDFCRRD